MNLLEKTTVNDKIIYIRHSPHIAINSIMSLILKNLADKIDKEFINPNIEWENYQNAQVVFVTNNEQRILGGIVFCIKVEINVAEILTIFSNNEEFTDDILNLCMASFKNFLKFQNINSLMQIIHLENHEEIKAATNLNLQPKYYVVSSSFDD